MDSIKPYRNLSGMSGEQARKYIEKRLYDSLTQFKGEKSCKLTLDNIKSVLQRQLDQFYAELRDRPQYNINVHRKYIGKLAEVGNVGVVEGDDVFDPSALVITITEIDTA